MSEHDEQRALFAWAEWQSLQWPELALMFAIPNGGHRHKAVAAKMKAEGVKKGVLDIFLPVPMYSMDGDEQNHKCGLFIEMKFGKNKPTKEQLWWIKELQTEYRVEVCYSAREAMEVTADYLGRELAF